jgi:hypothetical protein
MLYNEIVDIFLEFLLRQNNYENLALKDMINLDFNND